MLDFRAASNVVLWLVAAVILHDLLLLPPTPRRTALDRPRSATRGAINYVRVPAGLSLLMLLVFWGTIRGKGDGAFHRVSGLELRGLRRALAAGQRRAVRLGRSTCGARSDLVSLARHGSRDGPPARGSTAALAHRPCREPSIRAA